MNEAGNKNAGPGLYLLTPVPCEQVQRSRQMILAAAEAVHPGRAAVLGAGNCTEIPLSELAVRFDKVLVCDVDASTLEAGIAAAMLSDAARAKLDVRFDDLTGVTEPLLRGIHQILSEASAPEAAIERMVELVESQPLPGAGLEDKYDLVVASCVLSQLHFGLLHRSADLFARKFGDSGQLPRSERWAQTLYDMARRMEARFIDDLAGMLAPGGMICLSATAQMCDIRLNKAGQWASAGTYRMLRTQDLTDYLDKRFTIVAGNRWHWVARPPQEPGDTGRLFDVQALVLRASP
mgnify:CR=1 FL=1